MESDFQAEVKALNGIDHPHCSWLHCWMVSPRGLRHSKFDSSLIVSSFEYFVPLLASNSTLRTFTPQRLRSFDGTICACNQVTVRTFEMK